jgi:hypothetical protein
MVPTVTWINSVVMHSPNIYPPSYLAAVIDGHASFLMLVFTERPRLAGSHQNQIEFTYETGAARTTAAAAITPRKVVTSIVNMSWQSIFG